MGLRAGSSEDIDLDGGPTRLVSPTIDLSAPGEYLVRYARWMRAPDGDGGVMGFDVSNDDGATWHAIDTLFGDPLALWGTTQLTVYDFIVPTATMKFRFSVTDTGDDSAVEAALDSFSVSRVDGP